MLLKDYFLRAQIKVVSRVIFASSVAVYGSSTEEKKLLDKSSP